MQKHPEIKSTIKLKSYNNNSLIKIINLLSQHAETLKLASTTISTQKKKGFLYGDFRSARSGRSLSFFCQCARRWYDIGVDYRVFGAEKLDFGTRFGPDGRVSAILASFAAPSAWTPKSHFSHNRRKGPI